MCLWSHGFDIFTFSKFILKYVNIISINDYQQTTYNYIVMYVYVAHSKKHWIRGRGRQSIPL